VAAGEAAETQMTQHPSDRGYRKAAARVAPDDAGNPDSAIFDLIADLADSVARQLPLALLSAVKAVFG